MAEHCVVISFNNIYGACTPPQTINLKNYGIENILLPSKVPAPAKYISTCKILHVKCYMENRIDRTRIDMNLNRLELE